MKKYFSKQTVLAFVLGSALFSSVISFAAVELNVVPNPFPVIIDGNNAIVDAYNINGYTYLKLADIRQTGLKVVFNETDSAIEITSQPAPQPTIQPTPTVTPQSTLTAVVTPQPTPTIVTTVTEPTPTPISILIPDNTAVYNVALASLTLQYNLDIAAIDNWMTNYISNQYNFMSQTQNLREKAYFQSNIDSAYANANTQKAERTATYNTDVAALKTQYGM